MNKTDKANEIIKNDTNEMNENICISEKTLDMMDKSMNSLSIGKVGKTVDISQLKENK